MKTNQPTIIQIEHHTEQMEVARRDFGKFWATTALPKLKQLAAIPTPAMEHVAWAAFKAGLQIESIAKPFTIRFKA